ncbi:MAG: DNA primase [Bacteroidales bacterium]|nr:DNA primase [Bacteroidales bacterium]
MIDQATIDRIMDAANIVDVVSDYVTLHRSGASYKGLCPFHDDKTPSFYVNPARGICKCFSCGKGGNVVHFIMEQEQLRYYEALKFLAKRYGIEVKEREMTNEERQSQSDRESMFAVNEWASRYFHDTMLKDEDARAVGLAYFRNRGFRDDIIEKFRLGYSPDSWDAMSKAALKAGYKEDFLCRTSLSIKRDKGGLIDKFRGRVIFPWFNVSGKVSAFGGRKLDSRTKGVEQKYINSNDSEIFHKLNELYGIYQAKKQIAKEDLVYMVEGYTDVISMHQCGIENVVANSGTALNQAQIRLLHRFTSNITLVYDGDEAGIHAALRGTDMLLAEGMNVKVLLLPDGDDPDSFARKHNATEFKQYVEQHQTDFILFKVNLLISEAGKDPLKRSQLVNNILDSIKVIPDEILRSTYLHECAELMHMDEQMLARNCSKMRRAYLEQRKVERERERQRQAHEQERKAQAPVGTTRGASMMEKEMTPIGTPHGSSLQEETELPPPPSVEDVPQTETIATPLAGTEPSPYERKMTDDLDPYIRLERMIMTLVVRYGELPMTFVNLEGKDEKASVAQYVQHELTIDGLTFHHPLYVRMLDEACQHVGSEGFSCSRYFVSSPDLDMSREATDLLADRYQLSKSQQMPAEEEMMNEYISRLLLDYKFLIVNDELKLLKKQLADPAVMGDIDKQNEVMQQFVRMNAISRALAKRVGERIYLH